MSATDVCSNLVEAENRIPLFFGEIGTNAPHSFFKELTAQDLAHIFEFFLTFLKDVLPIVSINTILLKFRQLY